MNNVVRIENSSSSPFLGWVRTNIDWEPPAPTGYLTSGGRWAVGRPTGADTRILDLHVEVAAGATKTVALPTEPTQQWTVAPLAGFDVGATFGGLPAINGAPMELRGLIQDGAGYTSHWVKRLGRLFCANLWITWYPDQPWMAHGEAIVVASNPSVPDLTENAPAITLTLGNAIVLLPLHGLGPIATAGTSFGDGQGRATPVNFVWLRHCTDPADFASIGAVMNCGVRAVGLKRLLPEGNPTFPANFDPHQWAAQRFGNALRKLGTWEAPVCGPAPVSGVTGAQEDQLFHPGGEAMLPDGVAAATVRYLAALHLYLQRPCHHLEADGSPLTVDAHPDLKFWDSRPHWHTGVSPDQLGKQRALTVAEANNAWGEDTQHALFGTLFGAARLTGSPALQWLLRHRANAYLLQRTLDGSTAGIFSAREIGYECLFAVQCHENLEDRAMAARVVDRWRRRMREVVLPFIGTKDYVTAQENHWGTGWWVSLWEQSLCAYGLDLGARMFSEPDLLPVAKRLAERALRDGWAQVGGQWVTRPMHPVAADVTPPDGDGSFNRFGMPLCAWVVLRQEPTNAKARAVWDYLLSDPNGARNWMPPGVQ